MNLEQIVTRLAEEAVADRMSRFTIQNAGDITISGSGRNITVGRQGVISARIAPGGLTCSTSGTRTLVISGALAACGCQIGGPDWSYTTQSHQLNGSHTLSGSGSWSKYIPCPNPYTDPACYAYTIYVGLDCSGGSNPNGRTPHYFFVTCAAGLYTLTVYTYPQGSAHEIWSTSTPKPLGQVMTNTLPCGGTATLS